MYWGGRSIGYQQSFIILLLDVSTNPSSSILSANVGFVVATRVNVHVVGKVRRRDLRHTWTGSGVGGVFLQGQPCLMLKIVH